jgi:hypothetical protein
MGFFGNSSKESEEIRGIKDADLPALSNEQLICVALARLFEGQMLDDDVLVAELYKRGGRADYP